MEARPLKYKDRDYDNGYYTVMESRTELEPKWLYCGNSEEDANKAYNNAKIVSKKATARITLFKTKYDQKPFVLSKVLKRKVNVAVN